MYLQVTSTFEGECTALRVQGDPAGGFIKYLDTGSHLLTPVGLQYGISRAWYNGGVI